MCDAGEEREVELVGESGGQDGKVGREKGSKRRRIRRGTKDVKKWLMANQLLGRVKSTCRFMLVEGTIS